MPLGTTISGSAGYRTYITALKESYNISRQNELTTQEITPQETNMRDKKNFYGMGNLYPL